MRRTARAVSSAATVALAATAALVGCGGGDSGPALSDEEFRRQGNAICASGDRELEAAGRDLFGGDGMTIPSPEAIATFFTETAIPIARKKLDQLERLNPPARHREALVDLVAAGREATAEVEEGLRRDPEGFLAERGPDPFEDFDDIAADLGLDKCAGGD